MADKRIDQLTTASSIGDSDYLLVEQSGIAKKILGSIFHRTSEYNVAFSPSGTADNVINQFCAQVAAHLGYATYTAARSWPDHVNGLSIIAHAPKYQTGEIYRISGVLYDWPNGCYLFIDNYNATAGTHSIKVTALIPWA